MERIASFCIDHDVLVPGMYISRVDGDVVTYDIRFKRPNGGDYLSDAALHTVEHLFATFVRNGTLGKRVIYFGPMGCRTGFYLLVRDTSNEEVLSEVKRVLTQISENASEMPGATRVECGNYRELDLEKGKAECARYLAALNSQTVDFKYY